VQQKTNSLFTQHRRSFKLLKPYFEKIHVGNQGLFSEAKRYGKVVNFIPEQGMWERERDRNTILCFCIQTAFLLNRLNTNNYYKNELSLNKHPTEVRDQLLTKWLREEEEGRKKTTGSYKWEEFQKSVDNMLKTKKYRGDVSASVYL